MAAGAKLLCLQNGLGNCEQAAARFGAERVLYGGTSQGAYLDRNGVLQRMGEGRWRLAAIGADADAVAFVQDLVSLFARAGLQAEEVGDWRLERGLRGEGGRQCRHQPPDRALKRRQRVYS